MKTRINSKLFNNYKMLVLASCFAGLSAVAEVSVQERGLELLRSLKGDWVSISDPTAGLSFFVESGESIVRETVDGMVNIMYRDLDKLVLVHYCSAGNQPRFELKEIKETTDGTLLDFELVSVGNHQMGEGHISNADYLLHKDGTLKEFWTWTDEKGVSHQMVFSLQRKAI